MIANTKLAVKMYC